MRWCFGLFLLLSACAVQLDTKDYMDARDTAVKVSDASGHGSGTIISKDLVLTAAHVVRGVTEFDVEFYDGTTVKATVEWVDTLSDTALLRLASPARFAAVVDCSPLKIGDRVFTLGNPGLLRFVLTEGVVAGSDMLGAQQAMLPPGMPVEMEPMIIVSIDWEGGDSGAGVFDSKGHLRAFVNGGFWQQGHPTNNSLATPVSVLPHCAGEAE